MARENKAQILILSALGCGAFGNPPEHMAFIFQEVLAEFAGAFKKIYFAIKGGRNLEVFRQVLTGRTGVVKLPPQVTVRKPIIEPAEVAFEMISPDKGEQKLICSFGGNCRDVWMRGCFDSDCAQLFHPAVCDCGKTPKSKFDRWHFELFTHPRLGKLWRAKAVQTRSTLILVTVGTQIFQKALIKEYGLN